MSLPNQADVAVVPGRIPITWEEGASKQIQTTRSTVLLLGRNNLNHPVKKRLQRLNCCNMAAVPAYEWDEPSHLISSKPPALSRFPFLLHSGQSILSSKPMYWTGANGGPVLFLGLPGT